MRSARQSDIPESPFLWTRGTAARETLRYLDRKRIEAEPLLAKAELSRDQMLRDASGISAASQYRFLELAATETDESLLGLRVAAEMDMRDVGVLFYLAASSATVATALAHLVRYAATTSEEVRLEVSRLRNETVLTHRPMLAFDEPRRQFSEFIALALMRVLCKLTNRDIAPSRVTFAHARNTELREIHRILRCPVEFAHSVNSWAFPESIVQLPIVSADSQSGNQIFGRDYQAATPDNALLHHHAKENREYRRAGRTCVGRKNRRLARTTTSTSKPIRGDRPYARAFPRT